MGDPLPFRRKVAARLHLELAAGAIIGIFGERPAIELSDPPLYLGT